MIFGSFLMLIAVVIAGVSAYFSVYGLAHIFAATFWSVVIMGAVLEVGKLVATSFLYRYWERITWSLRVYLLAAIAGLMVITSAGIFGYLSNAYQQDIVGVKDVNARIELLDNELTALTARELQINADIDRIGSNFVTARQNMMKQYGPEKDKITKRIADIRTERLELSTKQLEVEAHTGPIIYIAKAMDKGVDTAVMWMICLIIFVFDPLAVALTIGANVVLSIDGQRRTERRAKDRRPGYLEPGVLERAAEAGDERLQEHINKQSEYDPERPFDCRLCGKKYPSMMGADMCEGDCLRRLDENPQPIHTDDEYRALEEDSNRKQDTIDELSADNQRMEDDLFLLAAVLEKKELLIAQLKDAVRSFEPTTPTYTIEERAALHAQNVLNNKTQ